MTLKLVAIDLDATLLRDDKSYDRERFDEVVDKLIDNGVNVVIASGNNNSKIKDYISENTLQKIYIAGDNGNDIEYADHHIHTNYFDRKTLGKLSDMIDADDDLEMLVGTKKATYSKYIYEESKDYINIYYPNVNIIESYDELPSDEEPIKSAVLSSKTLDETKDLLKVIDEKFEGVTSVTSGGGWFDVYHVDGGKGSAVEWIQKEHDISIEETMAFGDSLNDSSMMKVANYSVAMANADKDLKEICAYEIGNNEEQAVIDVLEKFIETDNLYFMKQYKK